MGAAMRRKRRQQQSLWGFSSTTAAVARVLHEDAFSPVLEYLTTSDALRMACTSKHFYTKLPALLSTMDINADALTCAGLRRFTNVRQVTVRATAAAGRKGALRELLACLPSLEALYVGTDAVDEVLGALDASVHGRHLRSLCITPGTAGGSSLAASSQKASWASQLMSLFATCAWPALKHLQLAGDWFEEQCLQFLLLLLSRHGIMQHLEALELCLPVQTPMLAFAGGAHGNGTKLTSTLGRVLCACGGGAHLKTLRLHNVELQHSIGTQSFIDALGSPCTPVLEELDLSSCTTDSLTVSVLADALARARSLRRVSLSLAGVRGSGGSHTSNNSGVSELAAVFSNVPHMRQLQQLSLSHCHGVPAAALLSLVMSLASAPLPHLRALTISDSCMDAETAQALTQLVSGCPRLQRLNLARNAIADSAAMHAAAAARRCCPDLALLQLGGNRLTDIGAIGLVALLHRATRPLVLDFAGGVVGMAPSWALFPSPSCVRSIIQLLRGTHNAHFTVTLSRAALAGATGAIVMGAGGVSLEYSVPRKVAPADCLRRLGFTPAAVLTDAAGGRSASGSSPASGSLGLGWSNSDSIASLGYEGNTVTMTWYQ
ncbi:hypothetical protein JKP88DRAFT_352707 [Tribonema minus]|uniref:Uncharacterized protein n=1 Tax=Tribonema minus TaxID=303371 RepID=A0A835ZB08_9STRA|nr:hypothetical protein JKP88DRAFT_352707 [Tribonema minus]